MSKLKQLKSFTGFLVFLLVITIAVAWAGKEDFLFRYGITIGGTSSGDIVTINDTQTLTNKTLTSPTVASPTITGTITATGLVSATNIADVSRQITFPGMAGWVVDSSNDIDDATAPNITVVDNIPAAVWDNSGETTGIMHTFQMPNTYNGGLTLYVLISSSTADGTTTGIDWQIWENIDGTVFDAGAVAQSTVLSTESSLNTKNDVLTLTYSGTALVAGRWYTVELFNATTHASANLEVKGVSGEFTSTQ